MDDYEIVESSIASPIITIEAPTYFSASLQHEAIIYTSPVHNHLQNDLMEHIGDLHHGN